MKRMIYLGCILTALSLSLIPLARGKYRSSMGPTLSPFFQELGKPLKSIDRAFTRMMPIDQLDERTFAEEIKAHPERYLWLCRHENWERDEKYLNSLIQELTKNCKKEFAYRVYLVYGLPNAYALPGGIICVTDEMLKLVQNEAELASILCHEIGHIEREHLFDQIRSKLLAKKKAVALPSFIFDALREISSISFSKSLEDEADTYGFSLLVEMGYDPFAMADAFQRFEDRYKERQKDPISDFFRSHPYTQLRKNKFRARAKNWIARHQDSQSYVGVKNLEERFSRFEIPHESEMRTQR